MPYFYITTTLPYANAQPHLGHAIEFLQADVIARYRRSQGDTVLFNLGTDEHGLKMHQKAQEKNQNTADFIAENRQHFYDFCEQFQISYDNFYATSLPEHHTVAQALWNTCDARGDIYKKSYTGKYCIGCEAFKTDKDLIDGKCPDHGTEPIDYEEENYFFRLSNYRDQLLSYIDEKMSPPVKGETNEVGGGSHEAHNAFVLPAHKNNELRNFVAKMEDISISRSRTNLPRGVPVPDDETQVMYVWFDALSNYIGAAGYPDDDKKLADYRGRETPQAVQICGPDNLRFQGAIRQGMLASAQLPRTAKLLVHGMILGPDGAKMSKTLGNVISPFEQVEKYGLDAFRYYMIAGIPTFGDASYKEEDLVNLYNAHLANSFGNLLNRVIHLANKKGVDLSLIVAPGQVLGSRDHGRGGPTKWEGVLSSGIQEKITSSVQLMASSYDTYNLYDAADEIHKLALFANEYISRPGHEPRNKEVTQTEVTQVLLDCAAMLQVIIDSYAPILPETCARAQQMLDKQEKGILFERI